VAEAIVRGLKSTLALFLVLAGLGAYIYFVESKKPDPSAPETKPKVFDVTEDRIQELQIKAASGETTTLKKVEGLWEITSPAEQRADTSELSGITNNLASLEIQRVVEEKPGDVSGYGLAQPRIEVGFKAEGDKDFRRLQIGDKTATGGDLYARRPDDGKVFLIAAFLESTFNRTAFDLREKAALKVDREKVDAIEVSSADRAMRLAKDGAEWKMTAPLQVRADFGAAEGLVGRFASAQMKAIVAEKTEDLKTFGLDRPQATVTFGAGSARATLAIGGKAAEDTVYARDLSRPMVFTIESGILDDVRKPAADYRRKDLFEFRPFTATRFEVMRDTQTFAFEKAKGTGDTPQDKWRRVAPAPAADADAAKVDALLSKFSNLRAQSFEDEAIERAGVRVSVRYDDGKRQEQVVFSRAGDAVYAAREGEPDVAKVDTKEFDDALKALDELK
jgi:hypothetical protein